MMKGTGMTATRTVFALAAAVVLSACGNGNDTPSLFNLEQQGNGPDEFAILPPRPLQLPENLAELPAPTPGGANLTDPTPNADAIVALGGNPGAAGGIPAGDAALVAHAGRLGTTPGIRDRLASEDLEWRRDNQGRVLERLFNVNVYYRAYADQSLDQQRELAFWRSRGARTPSAPPALPGE
jgi:Protein of unknown function (DUF3035)